MLRCAVIALVRAKRGCCGGLSEICQFQSMCTRPCQLVWDVVEVSGT